MGVLNLIFKRDGFSKKRKAVLSRGFPFLVFLLISLIILRGIVFSPSPIGFNHDWNFPMTNDSLRIFCLRSFFLWSIENAGSNFVYPAENLLRYSLFPFSLLGLSGLSMIGLVLLFTFTFGGYFMYSLLRNSFGLSCAPSVISGLFYITTPVIFNKVAAGHVPYIVAYALAPLVMACFVKYAHESKTKYLLITGLLVAFATIQIQFAIMLTLLLFFYAFLVAKMKVRVLVKTFLFIVILVSLV